jgi:hypothetical protein
MPESAVAKDLKRKALRKHVPRSGLLAQSEGQAACLHFKPAQLICGNCMDNDNYNALQNPNSDYSDSQNAPSPYSDKDAKTPATPAGPTLKVPTKGEVTILTSYPWNPLIDEKTEVE